MTTPNSYLDSLTTRDLLGRRWYTYWSEDPRLPQDDEIRAILNTREHVPNKNEGRLLRRIMSETGLTEEQVRSHKKYRRMLSTEQKRIGPLHNKGFRVSLRVLKEVTRDLKLPLEHPEVKKEYERRSNERNRVLMSGRHNHHSISFDEVLQARRAQKKGSKQS